MKMKKFMMMMAAVSMVLVLAGCCTGRCPGKSGKCPKQTKCTMPCAKKGKKCPFIGKWEFFVEQNGKLTALPVSPQPQLELCPKGVMRFHYAKNDKPAVLEGKWKVDNGALVISNVEQNNVQRYILQKDNSAVYTVGANDQLPQNTRVVIKKVK